MIEEVVNSAFEEGYRSIDTAFNYGNEEALGKVIASWIENGGKREELFVTTKVLNNHLSKRGIQKLKTKKFNFKLIILVTQFR